MKKEKCYICEKGNLNKRRVDFSMYGVSLGKFPAEVCTRCEETFFDEKTSDAIDTKAKEKGLWGLSAQTKINKVGTSIGVTINKKIARFMGLKQGEEVNVYPETPHKLVIDIPETKK